MLRGEIRIAGTGGQGIILGSKIIAESAGIHEGYNVVQSCEYSVLSFAGSLRCL